MLQNYFLLAFRNLLKNKTISLLNIVGWALGMAVCIAMLLFIRHERSFDRFHSKADRIYRLTEYTTFEGTQAQTVPLSMWHMAEMFQKDYPEIENTVRVRDVEAVLKFGDRQISSKTLLQVDSSFFSVFDFPALSGNTGNALQDASGIALTATFARKLFGTAEAMGRIVEINRGDGFKPFTVRCVLKDVPENSHLQFDALLPMHELVGKMKPWMESWDANWVVTYLLFRKDSKPDKVMADLPPYVKRYLDPEQAPFYTLNLQALPDMHLGSSYIAHDSVNYQKFDGRYVTIFGWLAVFVLLIASFNFINITIARTTQRAREVGIRKSIGARKIQLIGQFTGEAVLTAVCALALALVIVSIGLPALNLVIDRKLSLPVSEAGFLAPVLGAALLTGLFSGIYPAIVATRFSPAAALKGNIRTPNKQFSLRSGLVVLQFSIAVTLVISMLLAVNQLDFIRNKNLGFDKSQVVQITMNGNANKHFDALRTDLLKNPYVKAITASGQRLGNNVNQMGARSKADGAERRWAVSQLMVDYNYLDFFQIPLLEGRSFSTAMSQDKGRSFIINEAFAKEMGIEHPVGQPFRTGWQEEWGSIIGVVKDFNFNSLHHRVVPICISIQPWDFREMSVKIDPLHSAEALSYLETTWKQFVPDMPFEYVFLDDHFAKLYKTDTQVSRIVSISSFIAILIACMGLFGLALFVVQTRTKEIGIRKVLGASAAGITVLMARDFMKLVLIAICIASPLAWYGMDRWLTDFAYRIDMQWWVFALAGLIAVAVAFLTVSLQSMKAALANPVETLRNE